MKLTKSKQFLADAIHASGKGWPDSAHWAAQDGSDGAVSFFSGGKPEYIAKEKEWLVTRSGCRHLYGSRIKGCSLAPNWHQTVLSREEYFSAYPADPAADADGWIIFGSCAINLCGDEEIDVKLSDGSLHSGIVDEFDWGRDAGSLCVASYRLRRPDVEQKLCKSVTRSIPEPELRDAESRLAKALELVKASAPHLLSDKYKFSGDEVMGERKPTIEQLATDYRNKLEFANRKRKEADDAKAAANAALGELERAGEALGLVIGISKQAN